MKSQSDRPTVRPSAVFLGADAGGSHTTVVIGTADLTILGRADGPPAAMKPGGAPASAAVLSETGRRAAAHGGIALPVEGALVAAAGVIKGGPFASVVRSARATRSARPGVIGLGVLEDGNAVPQDPQWQYRHRHEHDPGLAPDRHRPWS